MNTPATVALFAISTLSLITSATTLAVVLVGAKKVEAEMDAARSKAVDGLNKIKSALDSLEI